MPIAYSYMISVIHSHIYSGASIFMTNKSFISRDFGKSLIVTIYLRLMLYRIHMK